MPLYNPRKIAFSTKLHKAFRIKGRGLIRPNNSLSNKLHVMSLYSGRGVAVRKHLEGGTIRNHRRPYDLVDAHEQKPQYHREFKPILFKL
jgi:hypothetical protein